MRGDVLGRARSAAAIPSAIFHNYLPVSGWTRLGRFRHFGNNNDDSADPGFTRPRTDAGHEHHAARARVSRRAHAARGGGRVRERLRPAVRRRRGGRGRHAGRPTHLESRGAHRDRRPLAAFTQRAGRASPGHRAAAKRRGLRDAADRRNRRFEFRAAGIERRHRGGFPANDCRAGLDAACAARAHVAHSAGDGGRSAGGRGSLGAIAPPQPARAVHGATANGCRPTGPRSAAARCCCCCTTRFPRRRPHLPTG